VFQENFLDAVWENGSLHQVEIEMLGFTTRFDAEDRQILDYCTARNQGMDAWIDNPPMLHAGLRSLALAKGFETGPENVFQALVATSLDLKSTVGTRKRKRPQYLAS